MKKIIYIAGIICVLFLNLNAIGKNRTNQKENKAFRQTFHHAKNVHRFDKANGTVEYDFLLKRKYVAALYDQSGNLVETDYSVDYKKVPGKGRAFISVTLPSPVITEVTKVNFKNNFFYRVHLSSNGVDYSVVVTPAGEVTIGY